MPVIGDYNLQLHTLYNVLTSMIQKSLVSFLSLCIITQQQQPLMHDLILLKISTVLHYV